MFKEINATFKVINDNNKINTIYVKRFESGAFRYGDCSAHEMTIVDNDMNIIEQRTYDTRYSCISTNKEEWVRFWQIGLEEKYNIKLSLLEYEERVGVK